MRMDRAQRWTEFGSREAPVVTPPGAFLWLQRWFSGCRPRPRGESNACSSGSLSAPRTAAAWWRPQPASSGLLSWVFLRVYCSARIWGLAFGNRLTTKRGNCRKRSRWSAPIEWSNCNVSLAAVSAPTGARPSEQFEGAQTATRRTRGRTPPAPAVCNLARHGVVRRCNAGASFRSRSAPSLSVYKISPSSSLPFWHPT